MCAHELLDRLRRLSTDALDNIGLGTKDAVLVILSDGGQMRRQVVGKFRVLDERLAPGVDRDVHILDRLPQRPAGGLGDLRETHVAGTSHDVAVAQVWCGVGQDTDDHPRDVFGAHRRVLPVAEREMHLALATDAAAGEQVEVLGEERGPDMYGANAGPVEQLLGQPMIVGERTPGALARGNLRHVHKGLDAEPADCEEWSTACQ